MKNRWVSIQAATKATVICSMAAMLVTLALSISAQAQLDPSVRVGLQRLAPVSVTPPVNIVAGQTLRMNLFNQGSNAVEIVPCFLDADGNHLKMGDPLTIAPGQTRTYDLSYGEAAPPERSLTARGAVHADHKALEQLVVSGEVFEETTGK